MKYFVFFSTFIFVVPVLAYLSGKYKKIEKFSVIGFFLTTAEMIDINFYSMETYKGTSNGFEFGLVDFFTVVLLYLVVSRRKQTPITWVPKGSILFALYFMFSFFSIINSANYVVSFMEIWSMIRIYTYYWTFTNYLNQTEDPSFVLKCIGINIVYIFLICIKLRYIDGAYQIAGPFAHQNGMVVYINMISPLIFAYFFNGKKSSWYGAIYAMAAICVIFSLSRGGMACHALAIAFVVFYSLLLQANKRKIVILFVMGLMAIGVSIKSFDTIYERFTTAPKESKETRITLIKTAFNMANSHFLGVGLNNFPLKGVYPYPYAKHELNPSYGKILRSTGKRKQQTLKPETIYGLIMAESGYITLFFYLCFILSFLFKSIINIFRYKGHEYYFYFVGISSGLAAVYFQGVLEWSLKYPEVNYMQMMIYALASILPAKIMGESHTKTTELSAPG